MPSSVRAFLLLFLAFALPLLWVFTSEWISVPLSLAMAAFALVCLVSALRRRTRSLAAARASSAPRKRRRKLRDSETTIAGSVEYDEERDVAMRVEVIQEGSEQQVKGSWSHTWAEVSRTVTAVPFFVVTDAGERIRVEPDESSLFWDEFEKHTSPVPTTGLARRRARTATLSRGEQVWVTGRLRREARSDVAPAGDYRAPGVGEGWVMRAPPTLFVTSVPLAAHHRERAAMHGRHALVHACLLLAALLAPLGWTDRALGTTEQGTVTSADVHRGKNNSMSWTVHVETPSGPYSEKVSRMPVINRTVPVRRGRFTSNLGDRPLTTPNESYLVLAVSMAVIAAYFWLKTSSLGALPWYRRPGQKFVESGPGRLS